MGAEAVIGKADAVKQWLLVRVRLRWTKRTGLWSLYWRDRNLKFHIYDRVAATAVVEDLLAELDDDPIAILWG